MKRFLFIIVMLIEAFLLSSCSRRKLALGIPVRDGFESPTMSDLWETDKILPSDAKLQGAIVRNGHSALQITLHTYDKFEAGQNGNKDSERAELTEADWLISQQGKSYAFTFSMFLPADFPIVKTRLVIAQWKQECPWCHVCDDNSPVLAVRFVAGILYITQTISIHQTRLWQSNAEFRNRWLNFKFITCFDTSSKGRIVGYLNDTLIVNFNGPTTYKEDNITGYPAPSRFYFKMGLYRDTMLEPMTIFIDDYSKVLLGDNCQCDTIVSTVK